MKQQIRQKQDKTGARILMGPGPSNVHKRVYDALSRPILGHLDPQFHPIMDEICQMLREVFKTTNELTIPVSGTGSAGMEACFANVVERGDKVVIGVNGLFGERMVDVAERCGAEVLRVEEPWGTVIDEQSVIDLVSNNPGAKLVAIVQAETSTGVLQPFGEIADYLRQRDILMLVDAVTSLGGSSLSVDEWGVDICYSGTQKCLSVPPGLSPITMSEKALDVISNRKTKVQSWYLDMSMIKRYWGNDRLYHHTAPISMLYALSEGLKLVLEEGLDQRVERHKELGDYLKSELVGLGFSFFAPKEHMLPMLTSVYLPDGLDDAAARRELLDRYGIEVGAGLGETKGKIWRIGLMGETCRKENVDRLISALRNIMGK